MMNINNKITYALASIKSGIDSDLALDAAKQCKAFLEGYYENVFFGTHANADIRSRNEKPNVQIMKQGKHLLLCLDGKIIDGQKTLKITSEYNELCVVTVELILTKDMLNLEEIK